ncbi:MAG: 2-oxoglutarate dehydrogenase E1 component [Alphaproteobacteria bacterium]|nr:2-oxoglutarate dehydrogenase E1 component [Alphaproteobacteria bacterium]
MQDLSFIYNSHPNYIEQLYKSFKNDPASIDEEFKLFFEGFDFAVSNYVPPHANLESKQESKPIEPAISSIQNASLPLKTPHANLNNTSPNASNLEKELQVYRLISGYRNKGHLLAKTNPLKPRKDRNPELELKFFNLTSQDLQTQFKCSNLIGLNNATLKEILEFLQKAYTGKIGIEFKYISNQEIVNWLSQNIEFEFNKEFTNEKRRRIFDKINQATVFENFLQKKFIGQKRFSLEGGETTIAALDAIIQSASNIGVEEFVIGMAHRGRLNVLANVLDKTYESIFSEFEGEVTPTETMGSGDVKYHLGYSSEINTLSGKTVYVKLMPNPSHLEAVDPVVLGYTRSNADILYNSNYDKILPLLIHGDSSIAGQGIIYEILQMSKLKGYYTGGTIHFVINNQIGFTTDFDDARSSAYCTSLAAMIQAPVLHVNGDDPEAVVKCVELAVQYRQKYKSDIFIDMVCYRKHGHNEGDDPKYTQPNLYALIENHPSVREIYFQKLVNLGSPEIVSLAKDMEQKFWKDLQDRLENVKQNNLPYHYQAPQKIWQSMKSNVKEEDIFADVLTNISSTDFNQLFNIIMTFPDDFNLTPKVDKLIQDKIKLLENTNKVDWATAELLAYASILNEGKTVRISGQDVQRGTFSHRHAVLYDADSNTPYNRLEFNNGFKDMKLKIYNSLLSEYGVLGFEYGYALANPDALVVWEAQFGDFANGAQTIIDQFIASGEQKWQRKNGLVMLLPHGYEGQGPEHSSARIERFLQLAADCNFIVSNVTTAANFFHLLRRQIIWPFRKPLINFTPKSNLRNPLTYSNFKDFVSGGFNPIIDDIDQNNNRSLVDKILLCSGKIYFDLYEQQKKDNIRNVAIIRIEQIYPLPIQQLKDIFQKYPKYDKRQIKFYWVQEEPLNMGAALFLIMNLTFIKFGIISRKPTSSIATGFYKIHQKEQLDIITTAFKV